jgi:hypothetical protein
MPTSSKIAPGQQFGTLTVMRLEAYKLNGYRVWACQCACGKPVTVRSNALKSQKSCGCRQMGVLKHGESLTRLHNIWHGIKQRCENTYSDAWQAHNSLAPEWREYLKFKKWALKTGYADDKQIKRVVTKDGFNSANCLWVNTAKRL